MRKLIFASISTVALLTLAACDNQGTQSGGADTGTTSATPAPATGDTGAGAGTTTTPPSTGGTTAPAQ